MCRPKERTHKHHIIPKYMEGSDTPENLVEVTVTQHAMFHFCNFQLWGNEEDRIAWRGLSGQITMDEVKVEIQTLGRKRGCKMGGEKAKELGVGVCGMTPEEKSQAGKKGGKTVYKNGTGIFRMTTEQRREIGKKSGQQHYENGTGFFSLTEEQKNEARKKAGSTNKKNKTGVCGITLEKRIENGKKVKELGIGIFKMTSEQKREVGKRSGQQAYENKTGIHNWTTEQRRENGKRVGKEGAKKTNAQVWECTVTGHRSNSGALSRFQKKRGIDVSNRIRIN